MTTHLEKKQKHLNVDIFWLQDYILIITLIFIHSGYFLYVIIIFWLHIWSWKTGDNIFLGKKNGNHTLHESVKYLQYKNGNCTFEVTGKYLKYE